MNNREQLIFDVFGGWAVECHRQFVENYENEHEKKHIKELRRAASEAFSQANENLPFGWFGEHKEKFEKAAYEYFLHGLHISDSFYPFYQDRLKRFNEKWELIENILSTSETSADALNFFSNEDPQIICDIEKHLGDEEHLTEEIGLEYLNALVAGIKKAEHETQFGEKAVFEKAGRYFAETIFANKKKPRGRPSTRSNLNTIRAYQFGRLVASINRQLSRSKLKETTISEVCELTFGDSKKIDGHHFSSEIEWALAIYFNARNVTVSAFLNSVSLGKSALPQNYFDDW